MNPVAWSKLHKDLHGAHVDSFCTEQLQFDHCSRLTTMLLCQMCGSVCDTELEEWIMFLAGTLHACLLTSGIVCLTGLLCVLNRPGVAVTCLQQK